jgi:uncharacterized protein YicC (UPF0701 family)
LPGKRFQRVDQGSKGWPPRLEKRRAGVRTRGRAMSHPSGDQNGDQSAIEAATRRLAQALDALESAVERRVEGDSLGAQLSDQLHALGVDRSKLASELDAQTARARRMETANRDVAARIDAAMQSIRAVLGDKP